MSSELQVALKESRAKALSLAHLRSARLDLLIQLRNLVLIDVSVWETGWRK
jgi:hypothetical protein